MQNGKDVSNDPACRAIGVSKSNVETPDPQDKLVSDLCLGTISMTLLDHVWSHVTGRGQCRTTASMMMNRTEEMVAAMHRKVSSTEATQ